MRVFFCFFFLGGGGGVGACMPPCVRVYIVIVKHFPCI